MQAHLEERTPVCKDLFCHAARATGFSIHPSCSPQDSPRVGPGGALQSAPAPQHRPLPSPPFPLGVGHVGHLTSLFPAKFVSSSLNITVCLVFHHPPLPPPFQILNGYQTKNLSSCVVPFCKSNTTS